MKRYERFATAISAYHNCVKDKNGHWQEKWEKIIENLMASAPYGSGIDCGTRRVLNDSSFNKLVFTFDFHHMDEMGGYDGWTEHTAKVTPSFLNGFDIYITGRNRNDIKDYLYDVYYHWLAEEVDAEGKTVPDKEVACTSE